MLNSTPRRFAPAVLSSALNGALATPGTTLKTAAAFRQWNRIDNWCSLCKEPFGNWNEHRGKRDHLCLELFFESVVHYQRQWAPGRVWASFDRDFRATTLRSVFGWHDGEERQRRLTVLQLLRFLRDEGVIVPGPSRWREPQVARVLGTQNGALAMYKWMHPHILNVFPHADAKQISALSQNCASMYNLETTFDVCGMKELLLPGDMPTTSTGEAVEIEYAHKAYMVRQLLGQLRFAMEVDTAVPKYHALARRCNSRPHLAVIAEQAGHALITDMIFCRVCEYVSRVEPVWREQAARFDKDGSLVTPTHLRAIKEAPHHPEPLHKAHALREICDGAFHKAAWD
mmetsp:Transcript_5843/g.18417  ORF Transcript_5843/g.18417 Transcript_5843/m.18417 type:complete len:343 (-) Transcript_5843:114-1142(-)